jgi:transposase-like protein
MSKRRTFSREFKLEALRSLDSGKKQATELARELGIPRSRLYAWRQQLRAGDESDAFPGRGRRVGKDAELAALKAENEQLREDNELLKKSGPLLREGITTHTHWTPTN